MSWAQLLARPSVNAWPRTPEAGRWQCLLCFRFVARGTVRLWGDPSSWWGSEPGGHCTRCGTVDVRKAG